MTWRRSLQAFSIAALSMTGAGAVSIGWGAEADTDTRARSLAATCRSCHERVASEQVVPVLDGMPAATIERALQEFRTGKRPGTVMPEISRGYTDAQIAALAAWFARQKP